MRKREKIEMPGGSSRYLRRDKKGQFTSNQSSVGKSLSNDRRTNAKSDNPGGQGDRGDAKSS